MPLSLFKRQRHDLPLRYHSYSGFPALVTAVAGLPGAAYCTKASVRSSEVIPFCTAYCLASTGSFLQAGSKRTCPRHSLYKIICLFCRYCRWGRSCDQIAGLQTCWWWSCWQDAEVQP